MAWRAEFEFQGGYDCMTHAWYIYDESDRVIAVLDLADYGQTRGDYDFRSKLTRD
jgi:hypothetical protein